MATPSRQPTPLVFVLTSYIKKYRRKDGAKAPSLLDHLDLRPPTFGANSGSDAKALDLRKHPWIFDIRSPMLQPWIFEIRSLVLKPVSEAKVLDPRNPISDAKALDRRNPISDAKALALETTISYL